MIFLTSSFLSLVVAPDVRQSGGVGLTPDVSFSSGLTSGHFFFEKKLPVFPSIKYGKNPFFSKKTGPLGGSGDTVYTSCTPLVGYTVTTNTTDKQTVDSDYSETIHQEMEGDHTTKEVRDEGVEKHSCQIELRGTHLKLVYYNCKQV